MDLSEYQVSFSRDPLMGLWSYTIKTPDGRTLRPPMTPLTIKRETIEAMALRRIEYDAADETITGQELAERVSGHTVQP